MSKAPAFQLYVADFMADPLVDAMTPEELGGYFRLLLVAWQQDDTGYLPGDQRLLAAWSRLGPRWGECSISIMCCFKLATDGRFYQKRMVEVATQQEEYRELQRRKGIASGSSRKRTAVEPRLTSGCSPVGTERQPTPQPKGNSPISDLQDLSLAHAKPPDQLWLDAVGVFPGAGLSDAWMLAKQAAPAKGLSPEEYFSKALGVFVAWVDGVRGARRPQKSPLKFVEHFARVQEILDGKREAVPAETPLPSRVHEPVQRIYEDLGAIADRIEGKG